MYVYKITLYNTNAGKPTPKAVVDLAAPKPLQQPPHIMIARLMLAASVDRSP